MMSPCPAGRPQCGGQVAYESLWDVADVLGVSINSLFIEPEALPSNEPHEGGRRPTGWVAPDYGTGFRVSQKGSLVTYRRC